MDKPANFHLYNTALADADPDTLNHKWKQLRETFAVDQPVTGTVVSKRDYGAWLDVAGFPALLEIICIKGLTPDMYRAGDWCPVGSQVTAFIGCFEDTKFNLRLYQVKPGEQRAARESAVAARRDSPDNTSRPT